jgi:opacity protein-like surface antigen
MKNFLIILLLSVLSISALYAQQVSGEATFGSFSQSLSNLPDQAVISVINNYAGTGKPGTHASVIQTGDYNNLNLNLSGSGNNVLTTQIGDMNKLNLDLDGSNSQYVLEQNGNSNQLLMKNIRSNGINFQSSQTGGANTLTLEGGSMGSLQSMKIEQSGGMKLIIESNPIFSRP